MKKNEVGKIYSVLAITGSVMPIGGDPAFRQLYSLTLSYLPRAVLLMAGCVSFACMVCNMYIFTQKGKMEDIANTDDDKESEPNSDEGFSEGTLKPRLSIHRLSILSIRWIFYTELNI